MALLLNSGCEPRYKLSKPRTRTSGVSPDSRPDLETSFNKESLSITNESQDTIKSRHSARQSVRESLYGDGTKLRRDGDSDDDYEIDGKPRRRRFSRTNTTISKRASMRLSLGLSRSSTIDARDESRPQDNSEDMNDAIKRRVQRDKLIAMNQNLEATIDERGGRERIISPIRRRSFFTPGLATRNPADMLAKPPLPSKRQQADFDYYYNPNLSVSSPLERIAALDLANRPTTPFDRAGTPGDLDYGLIGRLHITNGVASPAPSARSGQWKPSGGLRNSINYFNIPPPPSCFLQATKPIIQESRRSGDFTFAAEPIHHQLSAEMSGNETMVHANILGQPGDWSARTEQNMIGFHKSRSKSCAALPTFHDRTSLIAQDYISTLADNPFDKSKNPTPVNFEATTKPNEIEDALFEEQSLKTKASFQSLAQLDLLLPNVSAIADDDFEQQTSQMLARVGSSSSTLDRAVNSTTQNGGALLCKADSGYSSSTSTTSYRKDTAQHEDDLMIKIAKRGYSPERAQLNPPTTLKARRRPTPVTILTSSTNQDSIFSSPLQSSSTIFTMATTTSCISSTSKVLPPKRLQKARPRSQPPPSNRVSVQMHPEIDPNRVPHVPEELKDRMARRGVDLPPLEHTLPSVGHLRQDSLDLHRPPLSAPLRFPSPKPTIDRVWDQVMGTDASRPKPIRTRHSFLGAIQGKRSVSGLVTKNAVDFSHDYSGSLTEQQNLPQLVHNCAVSSPTSQALESRSNSMVALPDAEQVSRQRSSNSIKRKPIGEGARSIRKSSSVYTSSSLSLATNACTDAATDFQDNIATYTSLIEAGPLPNVERASSPNSNMSSLAPSTLNEALVTQEIKTKPCGLRKSSSEYRFDDRGGIPGRMPRIPVDLKNLPPLPNINDVEQNRLLEAQVKRNETAKKDLPPLPHQRKTSLEEIIPRGLTPCRETLRESMDWTVIRGAWSQDLPTQKSSEISEEHPEQIGSFHPLQQVTPHCQPTLPKLSTPKQSPQKPHDSDRSRLTRSASPERQPISWDPLPYLDRSNTPERMQHKWVPPRPQTLQREITEWPSTARSVSPQCQFDQAQYAQKVPEGLVARMSGRFEGGLSYNYAPGYGITGSAGTRGASTGMRKSVATSKGYGIDLTDIPIFVAPRV